MRFALPCLGWALLSLAACGGDAGEPLSDALEHIELIAEGGDPEEMGPALRRLEALLAGLGPKDRAVTARAALPRRRAVSEAWRIGRTLCYRGAHDARFNIFYRFDAVTGRPLAPLTLHEQRGGPHAVPSGHPDEITAFTPKRAVVVNVRTGARRLSVSCPISQSIAPVLAGEDFILAPARAHRTLVRVNRKGDTVWTCTLPGDVTPHRAAHGSLLVAQTRASGTCGIDLETGKRLWSESTGALGYGVTFGPAGRLLIEANQLFPRGRPGGHLTARARRTGKRLWQYRHPAMIGHRPVVHEAKGLVFAARDPGTVVCLRAKDGTVVWETALPAPPVRPQAYGPGPYSPAWALRGGRLLVLDREFRLHVLEVDGGARLASVAVGSTLDPSGERKNYDTPVALPWIEGDQLFVASRKSGVVAYPTRHLLTGREPPELRVRALRVKLLLRLGRLKQAAEEVARMQALRYYSGPVLEALAELCRFRNDRKGEVFARLRMIRARSATVDPRLLILLGLTKSVHCGPDPTNPCRIGDKVYVGSGGGRMRAYQAADFSLAGSLDLNARIAPGLTAFGDTLVLSTTQGRQRRVIGVRPDLRRVFDCPAPGRDSRWVVLNGALICSTGYKSWVEVAPLEPNKQRLGPQKRIECLYNTPVRHRGRLYYPTVGGGSRSYDGARVADHPSKLKVSHYRVNPRGDRPVAFGVGGVYEVDEHLRPAKRIVTLAGWNGGAIMHRGVVVVLCVDATDSPTWVLRAWDGAGAKLPLEHATLRYRGRLDNVPDLLPLGGGVLLAGRDLVYVDPRKKDRVWQFWPGGGRSLAAWAPPPRFREPLVIGDRVYATHEAGYLYEFSKLRILQDRPPVGVAPR